MGRQKPYQEVVEPLPFTKARYAVNSFIQKVIIVGMLLLLVLLLSHL